MKKAITMILALFTFSSLFAGFRTMEMKPTAQIGKYINIYVHPKANKAQAAWVINFLKSKASLDDQLLLTAIFAAKQSTSGSDELTNQIMQFFARKMDFAFEIGIGQNEEQVNELKEDCETPQYFYGVSIEASYNYKNECSIGSGAVEKIMEKVINAYIAATNNVHLLSKDLKTKLLEEYCSFLFTGN